MEGNSTDELEVDLRLSVVMPLHATWLPVQPLPLDRQWAFF